MTPLIAIIGGGPSGLTLARLLECNNIEYVVFERNAFADPVPGQQGGSLDIHPGTGQEALKRGGLSAEFEKLARRDATEVQVLDMYGKQQVVFGEDRDAPEIDRAQLRSLLLDSIPTSKVRWNKAVQSVARDDKGEIVISFADGSSASGFRLVVGADGTWSHVRPLLTAAKPIYSGKSYIEGKVSTKSPYYSKLKAKVGPGTMFALGARKQLAIQRMGDGSYRVYMGIEVPVDFFDPGNPNVDLSINDGHQAREFFVSREDYYAKWAPELKEIIANCEGGFHRWALHHMDPESLSWERAPKVTLLGDAAHVSTPFVGEGVNCAMHDALVLAEKIVEFGTGKDLERAVEEYEKDMFKRGRDLIERSNSSAILLYADDAPADLVKVIKGSIE